MNVNNIIVALVSAVVAVFLAVFVLGIGQDGMNGRDGVNGKDGVGGFPGPNILQTLLFRAGAVDGGLTKATSTAGNSVVPVADIHNRVGYTRIYSVTPTAGNMNLTLPATSSLTGFIPDGGDCYSMKLENATTGTAAITVVAGAGMDLQEPDGQNVVIGQNNYADIEFCRLSSSDMVVKVDETIPAD